MLRSFETDDIVHPAAPQDTEVEQAISISKRSNKQKISELEKVRASGCKNPAGKNAVTSRDFTNFCWGLALLHIRRAHEIPQNTTSSSSKTASSPKTAPSSFPPFSFEVLENCLLGMRDVKGEKAKIGEWIRLWDVGFLVSGVGQSKPLQPSAVMQVQKTQGKVLSKEDIQLRATLKATKFVKK
ncbi:unnamed protein product [Amoebophrya sp. A25]|nr:unnamed protein product [Amoebophrya sp. A25]|eukprot:GSA25T00024155001.1